jgi:hypothetical protein
VDVADHLDAHEVGGVDREQDINQVPRQEKCRHREDEAAEGPAQRRELGRVGDLTVTADRVVDFTGRGCGVGAAL